MKEYIWYILIIVVTIIIAYFASGADKGEGIQGSICGIHNSINSCCATKKFDSFSKPVYNSCR